MSAINGGTHHGVGIGVADYVVFGVSLVIPVIISLYYCCIKKQKSNAEFLMGNRSINAIPMSFSLCASYMSAVVMTGVPGEIAYHGWLFPITWLVSVSVAALVSGNLFIPVFYKMKLVSVYEYLELRYESRVVRLLGSLSYVIGILMYMGVVLYAPCLALQTITDLPIFGLILLSGITGTVYTVLGGLKAVVWTDLFQSCIMFSTLIAIIIKATQLTGDFSEVWHINEVMGRVVWTNWDPSPFVRNTSLGIFFGQFFLWAAIFSSHQTQVQRYCATKSLRQARISLCLSVVLMWIVVIGTILSGLAVYAVYWDCDPKLKGLIQKKDELVTYFVKDHLTVHQGLSGLFIAGLLGGALSTLSSGLNSLAAVIWEDVFVAFGIANTDVNNAERISYGIRPLTSSYGSHDNAENSLLQKRQLVITRSIATLMGVISIGFAVLASSLDGILQLANSVMASLAGPLLATFVLGFFSTTTNKVGAIVGIICGDAVSLWLLIGAYVYKPNVGGGSSPLPTYDINCDSTQKQTSLEDFLVNNTKILDSEKDFFYVPDADWQTVLYSTSYNLYAPIGFFVCLCVSIIVSLIVHGIKLARGKKTSYVEPLLLHPLVRDNSPLFCCPSYRRKHSGVGKGLFCPRHPYGGHGGHNVGQFNNLGNRQQLDPKWNEDSHYRWPSPSLPPTLKKGTTMNNKHHNANSHGNGGEMGRRNHIIGSTHPHHNYENYDTYEMEQQYFKQSGNRMFQKHNKTKGGGTLDHRVHPERTPVSSNDFSLYAESTKKNKKYMNNNNNPYTEEILDEFGDVVVVRSKSNHNDIVNNRRNNVKNSSLKNMSDSSGGGQFTSTTSAAFNDDESSDEGWTTEF